MRDTLIKAVMAIVATVLAAASSPSRAQDAGPALDGKALFLKNCAACHQPTGKGIPGAFPALAGNKFVQGKSTDVATVLLKGRGACRTLVTASVIRIFPPFSVSSAAAGAIRPRL